MELRPEQPSKIGIVTCAGVTVADAGPVSGEVAVMVVVHVPGGTPVTMTIARVCPSGMSLLAESSVTQPGSATRRVTSIPPGGAVWGRSWCRKVMASGCGMPLSVWSGFGVSASAADTSMSVWSLA